MKNKSIVFVLAFLSLLVMPNFVLADIGPKPSMQFNIIYEVEQKITLLGGEQYECQDEICTNASPLESYGPQDFLCYANDGYCRSIAYDYAPYHKLVLEFSDKTRESQIFETKSMDAKFNVRVTDDKLIVEKTSVVSGQTGMDFFVIALVLTLILELLTAFVYVAAKKISKKVLWSVLLANLISVSIFWLIFLSINVTALFTMWFLLAEIIIFIFETYFIYWFAKKTMPLKNCFVLSFLMNLISAVVGGMLVTLF